MILFVGTLDFSLLVFFYVRRLCLGNLILGAGYIQLSASLKQINLILQ
jgi:hypothetical protein